MTWQRKFVSQVGASVAEERRVNGEHQRLETGAFSASYQAQGDVPVFVYVELEPLYASWRGFRHFFYAACRYRRKNEDCFCRLSGCNEQNNANIRIEQLRKQVNLDHIIVIIICRSICRTSLLLFSTYLSISLPVYY